MRCYPCIIVFLCALLGNASLYAQEEGAWHLRVSVLGEDSTFLQEKAIAYQAVHPSRADLQRELERVRLRLAYHSYLSNSVDSLAWGERSVHAHIRLGATYKWGALRPGNVEANMLRGIGFRENVYEGEPLYYTELIRLLQDLQAYAENNGYPFASVRLDSVRVLPDHSISAQLNMTINRLITYEGIDIVGEGVKISRKYLQRYLDIQPGQPYCLAQIRDIPKKIRNIPFLEERKTAVITFKGSKATVHLFLEKNKASKFDFLVGVLPRNANTGSRLLLTIDGEFAAQNLLGGGERMRLEFRQIKQGTQRLDVEAGYPYAFGLPFGLDADFSLYKRDSTFLDVEYDFGFSYLFSANRALRAFVHSKQSILLRVDEPRIVQTRRLPDNLDTRYTGFGLAFSWERLDYRFSPRRGWRLKSKASAGFRTVRKNADIVNLRHPGEPGFQYGALYDSLDLRTFQYQLEQHAEGYVPFFPKRRGVVKIANRTGVIISPQAVYLNEQFRLGGNQTLRGFNEEALNASFFSISTLEYRFLLSRNAFIFLFCDYGYLQSRSPGQRTSDRPMGFGGGLTFETPVGLFGVSYAYGKQDDVPINFRTPKIHFGYLSYF